MIPKKFSEVRIGQDFFSLKSPYRIDSRQVWTKEAASKAYARPLLGSFNGTVRFEATETVWCDP